MAACHKYAKHAMGFEFIGQKQAFNKNISIPK